MGAAEETTLENDIKGLLRSCLLFQEADDEALEFALGHSEEVFFKKGEPIILENESNDHVYFVKKGSVEIVTYLMEDKRVQRLTLLKQGSHFAEFSILTKMARSGSAYAYEDCELLRIDGASFLAMLNKYPSVSKRLVKLLADLNARMENLNEFIPFYRSSQLDIAPQVAEVVPVATWKKYGVIPVSIGAGLLTVLMKDPHKDLFFQFLKSSYPNLSVVVYLINDQEFDASVEYAINRLKLPAKVEAKVEEAAPFSNLLEALRGSTLFKALPENVFEQMAPHLKPVEFKSGTTILKPGVEVKSYSLIIKGKVQLNRPIARTMGYVRVTDIKAGEGFGEVEILTGGKNTYMIQALEDTVIIPVAKTIIDQLSITPLLNVPYAKSLAHRLQTLGHISGIKYWKGEEALDFRDVVNLIPTTIITEQKILPLKIVDNEVILGTVYPDSLGVMSIVGRYLLDYRVKLLGITEEQFKGWHRQFKMVQDNSGDGMAQAKAAGRPVKASQQNASEILDSILVQAMKSRCSDVHLEPSEQFLTIRYRVDGVLRERTEKVSVELGKEIINRLKVASNMDITLQKVPQDGQLKIKINEMQVVARASTLPVKYGEKIVLRIIRTKNSVAPLNMLAPDRRTINLLQDITRCNQGLFLVTGPTGSGKTTTLYSMLNAINRVDINVITLEDPVEMEIPGFNQVEIDRKRGLDFGSVLRSVLRQDPDVIMVGEIRDEESAKIVFEAAITGHLVLSTLHSSSSLDVAPRLKELGVSPATISAGLLGVLTQRLLRANCRKCLTSRPMTTSEKEIFTHFFTLESLPEELKFGKGCMTCNNTGYYDRIPVFEVWSNTLPMRRALIEEASIEEMLKVAREDGFETLLEFGLKMVLNGQTTLDEVNRVLSTVG